MIKGELFYFFRLDHYPGDHSPVYRIARSYEDLQLRFGELYIRSFDSVTQLGVVTVEHIIAIDKFLLQQIC